jgi:hypothetical protein
MDTASRLPRARGLGTDASISLCTSSSSSSTTTTTTTTTTNDNADNSNKAGSRLYLAYINGRRCHSSGLRGERTLEAGSGAV